MQNQVITQKISNSKIFPDVQRTIEIAGIQMNLDISTFDLNYRIIYEKDGQDVTFNVQSASTRLTRW